MKYDYPNLSESQFEDLVVAIAQKIFGIAAQGFAKVKGLMVVVMPDFPALLRLSHPKPNRGMGKLSYKPNTRAVTIGHSPIVIFLANPVRVASSLQKFQGLRDFA